MREALPGKVSRTLHAAYSRTGPLDALPACNRFGLSDGLPPECAVTAQIAHRKYATQYARLVRIWVRTGSRFALRFALLVRTLLREAGANLADGYRRGYHLWLPVRTVARREVSTVVSTKSRCFDWQPMPERRPEQ